MSNALILHQFAFQRGYLSLLVDDIPDEQMAVQPRGVPNHPAWQLGHLAFVADRFASLLGQTPTLESWKDRFAPNSTPTADRSAYLPKADLLAALDDRRSVLAKAFERATPEELGRPNPNAAATARFPTIGSFLVFGMMCHENTHLGQLAVWRKAAGFPQALSKIGR